MTEDDIADKMFQTLNRRTRPEVADMMAAFARGEAPPPSPAFGQFTGEVETDADDS